MSPDDQTNDDPADDGLWMPIAELARLKGVERQTVHERVSKLESEGMLTTRPGKGKTRLVNVAEYDRLVNETTDFSRQQAADTARANRESDWGDTRLRDTQLQKLRYEAALKQIELRKAVGDLVEIGRVDEVIAEVGEELKKPLEQVPLRTDEIVAAAVSGGAAAVRVLLMEIVFDLRTKFTEALRKLDVRSKGGPA
jgi:DNA-binding transcriptional MocR family regulator